MKKVYSTAEVAKELGVNYRTLLRWLYAGEVPEPEKVDVGHDRRIWTQDEVDFAKAYKEQNYRKRS